MIELGYYSYILHSFNVNQTNLQYYVAPEYLKGGVRETYVFQSTGSIFVYNDVEYNGTGYLQAKRQDDVLLYYGNFFKNFITPSKCQVETLEDKYQYDDIGVSLEDLKYLSDNKFDNTNPKIQDILSNIKSIKEDQTKCVVETLNDKVANKDITVLDDLFLAAPEKDSSLNTGDIASYFDRFIIDPVITFNSEPTSLPYYVIRMAIYNKHQQYFTDSNLLDIKEKFCSEDYSGVLSQVLSVLIVSGNTLENQQKLKEVIVDYMINPDYSTFVSLTLLATIANFITCKFSLDNKPCLESGIHLMPQPYFQKSPTEQSFGKEEGCVSHTQEGGAGEIYIPLNKMDTIAHEFSHFLDGMMSNNLLPWTKGDESAEQALRKIANEMNFKGSLTEYVAYGVTNDVKSLQGRGEKLVDFSRNYQDIAQWRIEHVFQKSSGVLIGAVEKICPDGSSKIWQSLGNILHKNLTNTMQCFNIPEKQRHEIKENSLKKENYDPSILIPCINKKLETITSFILNDKSCNDIVMLCANKGKKVEDVPPTPVTIMNIHNTLQECGNDFYKEADTKYIIGSTISQTCIDLGVTIPMECFG